MHSWRVLILPYLGENGIYQQYNFDEPWDSPGNMAVTQYCPTVFHCASDPAPGVGSSNTNYLGVEGPGMFFDGTKARPISDIQDGTSKTIMVVEVENSSVHWSQPVDLDATQSTFTIASGRPDEVGSLHPGGAHVAYADGRVAFLNPGGLPPALLEAQCTVAGGD